MAKAPRAKRAAAATIEKKQRSLANLIPFVPGKSGNPAGRPKGARNKLGEAFLQDMLAAWEKSGPEAIQRVIEERPHEFIKTVAGILPSEVKVQTTAVQELSDDELAAALAALRSAIAVADAGAGSGSETIN